MDPETMETVDQEFVHDTGFAKHRQIGLTIHQMAEIYFDKCLEQVARARSISTGQTGNPRDEVAAIAKATKLARDWRWECGSDELTYRIIEMWMDSAFSESSRSIHDDRMGKNDDSPRMEACGMGQQACELGRRFWISRIFWPAGQRADG
ncbi:MAG: hypothetical protein OXD33_00900 [Rhodobacteraceae bacterium]|nr:hypothetical protein [Paracoccaceae bacterium]